MSAGNKFTSLDDEKSTESDKNESLESLHKLLRLERVSFDNKIAHGVYEFNRGRVKLESNIGLKTNFGYFENQINYLRPHEALFLLEMCKLKITFNDVIMSLEQAYAIFLCCENSLALEEYVVYSQVMRCGYNVKLYNPNLSAEIPPGYAVEVSKKDEMVWKIYSNSSTEELPDVDKALHSQIKAEMDANFKQISGRESHDTIEPPAKKAKVNETESEHLIDILKDEQSFKKYSELVSKFDFIKRHQVSTVDDESVQLNFHFDVFTAKQSTSEDIPSYRILVVKSEDYFPSNLALERLKLRQKYATTSLIAVVSESLSVHFCAFTS